MGFEKARFASRAMILRARHLSALRAALRDVPSSPSWAPAKSARRRSPGSSWPTAGARRRDFDLEDPDDLARLSDPMLALRPLRGMVVSDEVQRRPELRARGRAGRRRSGASTAGPAADRAPGPAPLYLALTTLRSRCWPFASSRTK